MDKSEIAVNKFKDGYNCAQSVLFSYADKLNISRDLALKMANGFGGGMGRKQEVCGALSGGILVLNLIYGRGENEEKQKQEIVYSLVRELMDKFEEKYGSVNCKKLLDGCELMTSEGQEQFKSNKLIEKCYDYVEFTVRALDEITEGKVNKLL
jgi:C_GCAxxG_C_C family probable redox protein